FRTSLYIKNKIGELKIDSGAILDIGAADGQTCIYFSYTFQGSKIIGFEPLNESYHTALENTKHHKNIEIRNIALSDMVGSSNLSVSTNSLSSSLSEININEVKKSNPGLSLMMNPVREEQIEVSLLDHQTKNIDDILLIKIDTQGTELKILQNGIETLSKTRFVLIEMNNNRFYNPTCQYYEVDFFLRSQGFVLVDCFVIYRPNGKMNEYDALYENSKLF
ncbi:MAG: FkbM family methyltransferase, partial [Bacteroidota bacterium]